MYLEHFNLTHTPFSEEPDINLFYPYGEREAVYHALVKDIIAGKPLIKFIGQEGSGKTLICKKISESMPASHDVVYIDNPIGSFDDLLRIICFDLGMNPNAGNEGAKFVDELHALVEQRREQGKKILVIIDEAEKLFLATLERLVRIICETEEAGTLRILLAGRLGLETNLEQLSIYCANVDIKAGYSLDPLTLEETGEYLKFRMEAAGLAPSHQDEIFTEGAIAKIHGSSQGNIRMINILAEESLQNSCSAKSFMVLLDHVDVEEEDHHQSSSALLEKVQQLFTESVSWCRDNIKIAAAGASALVLVILVIFLAGGDQEVSHKDAGVTEPAPLVEVQQDAVGPAVADPGQESIEPVEQGPLVADEFSEAVDESQDEAVSEPLESESVVIIQELEQVSPEEVAPEQVEESLETEVSDQQGQVMEEAVTAIPELREEEALESEPAEEADFLVIGPENKKKRVGDTAADASTEVSAVQPKQQQRQGPAVKSPPPVDGRNGELLFRERRRASANWLAEAFRGGYTIQLMMLSSNQAEYNLKKMLMKDAYYEIRDKLYILRKKTTPPTLFVYYGIFDSMEEARNVRNNMAVFLRKHHPYALSINDALKKTGD